MENLNAEQVKKALECCTSADYNADCPLGCPWGGINSCEENLMYHAIALIESQEKRIKKLTEEAKGLKQAMEHEHASFMETFGEYGEKCDKLTEENERLQAETTRLEGHREADIKAFKTLRADTVRKMHSEIKERCIKGGIYPAFVESTIDQIAKELEDEK